MEKQNETSWKTYISWESQPGSYGSIFLSLLFWFLQPTPGTPGLLLSQCIWKTGKYPGPCRVVVYTGNVTPALCVHSPATSSCTLLFHPALFTDHQNMKEIMPQKACCSQTPKKSFTQHEHLKWLTHRQDTKWQQTYKDPCSKRLRKVLVEKACWGPPPQQQHAPLDAKCHSN